MEELDRPRPWVLEIYFGHQLCQMLVNSGSSISMVRSSLLPVHLSMVQKKPESRVFTSTPTSAQ